MPPWYFLPWRHKSAQGNTEIVVKDLCPPEVLPRRECNGENCLRRPLGQSKSFRRVLCACFVCFVTNDHKVPRRSFRFNGMTPCFSRALRFSVVKNTRGTEITKIHRESTKDKETRSTYLLDHGIKAMGCRNSPLTIKPYPMKIQAEYR